MTTQGIDSKHIKPNPWQPRQSMDPAQLAELAESIKANGLLQPPVARSVNGHFELAFGHRRFAAWQIAMPGFAFPVEVRELTDREMSDFAAIENRGREDLTVIDVAGAIQRRMKDFGLTQLEAGAPFGYKSQGAVANVLSLLKLPEQIRSGVASGELPERLARQMVKVAKAAPKPAEALAKKITKAAPAEREEVFIEGLSDLLRQHGADLEEAPFDQAWPAKPIVLTGDQPAGTPAVLRPCLGCEYYFKHDDSYVRYCAQPECCAAKTAHFMAIELQAASEQMGIPMANADEKPESFLNPHQSWEHGEQTQKVLKLAAKHPEWGLRLISSDGDRYSNRHATGSEVVKLVALEPALVKKFLSANADVSVKAIKETAEGKPSQAAADKARRAEEAAKEKRRRQKAVRLRVIQDVVWLVESVTPIIARQLTISGETLTYVCENFAHMQLHAAAEFYGAHGGLLDFSTGLEELVETHSGAEAEDWRRQVLVLDGIFEKAFSYNFDYANEDFTKAWKYVRDHIEKLATGAGAAKDRFRPAMDTCFGVKLPKGWDQPPIHQTPFNCWQCGEFTSNTRLTKRDLEAGWLDTGKAGVFCSAEHQAAYAAKHVHGNTCQSAKPQPKTKKVK